VQLTCAAFTANALPVERAHSVRIPSGARGVNRHRQGFPGRGLQPSPA